MIWIALGYHLASRLAYVLYVGLTLKRQDRREYLTRRYGVEAGFQRFRRVAAFVMANDAVSLAVLCLVSADTLRVGLPRGLAIAVGAVLVVVGVSTKIWAARTDRKSTRLNSSHSQISYAVFCLKKKKKYTFDLLTTCHD